MTDKWAILNYEIQMYFGARHLQGYPINPSDKQLSDIQQSALVEVKALHTRILVEMFLERTWKDNINIDDLLPDWRKDHEHLLQILINAYNETVYIDEQGVGYSPRDCFNKFLAHPDQRRGDHFDWAPIITRMDPVLRGVLRTLPMDPDRMFALVFFRKYLK